MFLPVNTPDSYSRLILVARFTKQWWYTLQVWFAVCNHKILNFYINIKKISANVAIKLHYWNNNIEVYLSLPFQESVFQLWPLFPQSFLLFVPQFFLWCRQSLHQLQCVHSKQNFINKATFNERTRAQNKVVLIQVSVWGPTTKPFFTALKRHSSGSMLNWMDKLT